jgi:CubicO group peptidase (beta-lactamase class C family)
MNRFLTLASISLILCICQCNSDDPAKTNDPVKPNYAVEFLIVDQRTGKPVEGAEVHILEGGAASSSDKTGVAGFTAEDLGNKAVTSITDSVTYAFSIRHPDFRPREMNFAMGKKTVLLLPDSTGTYFYQKPLQVDDDIAIGSLTDVGFDTARIHKLMNKIAKPGYRDLHSILIYKDGKLVLEEYYYGNHDTINFENGVIRDRRPKPIWWTRNEKHYIASVNKALTSTITGIALESKGLTTDAYIKDYLPEYANYFENNVNKSAVKFRHALNMNLGFKWDEWGSNDLVLLWKSDNFADFLLSRTNKGPASEWFYNSASPNLVLRCLENIVQEPIRQWAHTNFYAKLGITDYRWQSQPGGLPEGAARMYMRPRDMLKVGITYLNNGKWNGEQVIPESWVKKCLKVEQTTSSGKYSHHFWIRSLRSTTFLSADGDGGNYIDIFPDKNMVIVITQGNYLQWPLYVNQAEDMIGNFILPAL